MRFSQYLQTSTGSHVGDYSKFDLTETRLASNMLAIKGFSMSVDTITIQAEIMGIVIMGDDPCGSKCR